MGESSKNCKTPYVTVLLEKDIRWFTWQHLIIKKGRGVKRRRNSSFMGYNTHNPGQKLRITVSNIIYIVCSQYIRKKIKKRMNEENNHSKIDVPP